LRAIFNAAAAPARSADKSRSSTRAQAKLAVAEGPDDGADLVGNDNAAIEFIGIVGDVLVGQFPAHLAGLAVAVVHLEAGLDATALLRDESANGVEIEIDVDAVGYRLLERVFHDQVLMEEAEGLFRRSCGETDERGVEVLQHLAPEVVDGAVALVGNDEVEGLDGDSGIVGDGFERPLEHFQRSPGDLVQFGVQLLAFEHRVESLDGRDTHLGHRIDAAGLQVLHVVKLCEDAAIIRGAEGLELFQCLAPEVAAVDQEQHAAEHRQT
jgi:hypothetical protein